MESTKELDIYLLLFAGTLLMIVLSAGIVFFIYVYRRKLQRQKKSMLNMQQKLQFELLQNNMESLETERRRFASDLHDGVGGKLAALRLHIARLEHHPGDENLINTITLQSKTIIDLIIEMTRRIAHNVMPPDFEFTDLPAAIDDLCDWINESSGLEIVFDCPADVALKNRQAQLSLYRIVQELLSNTIKHAGADKIFIRLSTHRDTLALDYRDDGRGMNSSAPGFKPGLGLITIQRRVDLLKGRLQLDTAPGKGFACCIQLPV